MGNACGGFQNPSLQKQMQSIKQRDPNQVLTLNKLRQLSQYYIASRNIPSEDTYYVDMLVSIRQLHLAEHMRKLQGKKKQQFISKIKQLDFQELDIMSNQALINKDKKKQYKAYSKKNKKVIRYSLEEENKDLFGLGSSVIRNRAVALMILIGCFGGNKQESVVSCLEELKTPSKKPTLQLLLQRVCYLNQVNNSNLSVIIIVEQKHQLTVLNSLKKFQLNLNITLKPYKTTFPNVSLNGQIILNNQNQFSYTQGKGDFLREINKLGLVQKLMNENIQYLHIIRSTNILQKVCDPFVLGYLQDSKLDVVSKLIPAPKNSSQQNHLFLVQTQTDQVCIKSNVPKQAKKYIFTNSIFMRLSYLQSLSKELAPLANQKMRFKECKTSFYDPIKEQFIFTNNDNNAMFFYRNPADLIVGNNYKFMLVAPEFQYCDINIQPYPEIGLSNNFKNQLGIQYTYPTDLLEISPLIYYDSNKGIDEIKKLLKESKEIGYPCYIKRLEDIND